MRSSRLHDATSLSHLTSMPPQRSFGGFLKGLPKFSRFHHRKKKTTHKFNFKNFIFILPATFGSTALFCDIRFKINCTFKKKKKSHLSQLAASSQS